MSIKWKENKIFLLEPVRKLIIPFTVVSKNKVFRNKVHQRDAKLSY